jgi:hypothetical protein
VPLTAAASYITADRVDGIARPDEGGRATLAVVQREPGLHPTTYLRLLFSQRAAAPGETVSVRVEGTDAGAMIRGKILRLDEQRDGTWQHVGYVVGASRWHPAGEGGVFAITLEGCQATLPLSFTVPPVSPADYRVRLDLVRSGEGPLADRTATLYGFFRVLDMALPGTP